MNSLIVPAFNQFFLVTRILEGWKSQTFDRPRSIISEFKTPNSIIQNQKSQIELCLAAQLFKNVQFLQIQPTTAGW
ncbi:hypothetical protein [Microcoleus sp. PH2017_02_FOX_O_A]|uniref:hypothetical protein n=1 Tax=Microcoleus sp. PH2017_02_FOX_O_A TaxID=2798813 RepID=UPI0025E4D299|nr:hypothetical protein [Microcoleus sp. PH2017_02_FOX_O_A]